MTFVTAGFAYTYGGVVSDPSLPIEDLYAKVGSPILGIGRTFNFFGLTSQVYCALPYSWAKASGKALGNEMSITRSGLSDMQFRLSLLFVGAPAAKLKEFAKYSTVTVMGISLTVITPTGQYFTDKLINLGTNRWSFKPEMGISFPLSKQWLFDMYAGIWLFTNNDSFYPGTLTRSQTPLITLQTHISYNISLSMWTAFDLTYYSGGQSSVNDFYKDDRQNNLRLGATFNLPVNKKNSIKIAYSTGAIVRFGANFSTISITWQTAFF